MCHWAYWAHWLQVGDGHIGCIIDVSCKRRVVLCVSPVCMAANELHLTSTSPAKVAMFTRLLHTGMVESRELVQLIVDMDASRELVFERVGNQSAVML